MLLLLAAGNYVISVPSSLRYFGIKYIAKQIQPRKTQQKI